ncbi:MAG: DUF3592 domain-containing protein [Firmicutes bacterium]|nr:DUF3592 domain-containing protein [Bacillota bacterium]
MSKPFLPKSYYKKQNRKPKSKLSAFLWGYALFIVVGFSFVIVGIFVYWQQNTIRTTWHLLEAKVIGQEIYSGTAWSEDGSRRYYEHRYKYKFILDGQEYEAWSRPYRGGESKFAINDTVKTYVNPKNPYECIDEYHMGSWAYIPIVAGGTAMILFIALSIKECKRAKQQPKTDNPF